MSSSLPPRRRATAALLPVLVLAAASAAAGCSLVDPRPGPVRAMAPRPNPPVSAAVAAPAGEARGLRERLRRAPWMTRFWEELSPAQRRRVAGALRRAGAGGAEGEAGATWDVMGLEDRAALVFGRAS